MPGFTFTGFGFNQPQIDNAGNVLFAGGWQTGPGHFDTQGGIFYGGPGTVVPVQIEGEPAGFPQPDWAIFPAWQYVLAETGTIVTRTFVGVQGSGGSALYVGSPDALAVVAGTGLPAVGGAQGTTMGISGVFRANGFGHVLFGQDVSNPRGSPPNCDTIAAGPASALSTLLQCDSQVPQIPGATFAGGIFDLSYNDLGWAGFSSFMEGPGIDITNHYAMFVGGPGDLQIVVREGDPAPGMPDGVTFLNFSNRPGQNTDGEILFFGVVQGPGITPANATGVWAGPREAPLPLIRNGDPAPGLPEGTTISLLDSANISDGHRVWYRAQFSGPGVTPESDEAFWWGDLDDVSVVIREGDPAPGMSDGTTVAFTTNPFFRPILATNDTGDLLLSGFVSGADVTPANDYALWFRESQSFTWDLVLRTGELFDGRTIAAGAGALVFVPTSGSDGLGQAFNDDGSFALTVAFTDGSKGIYRFSIPEPSGAALIILCAGCAGRFRPKRKESHVCC